MNTLKRNARQFYYKVYSSIAPRTETEGSTTIYTGENAITYGTLSSAYGNISASRGEVSENPFGESLEYDKVIVMATTNLTENSILWVDVTPVISSGDTSTPHDYKVVRIAQSLNSVQIAIQKVKTNGR